MYSLQILAVLFHFLSSLFSGGSFVLITGAGGGGSTKTGSFFLQEETNVKRKSKKNVEDFIWSWEALKSLPFSP